MTDLPDNTRTALITGATGFIGSHLAGRLVADGWTVHAILRKNPQRTAVPHLLDGVHVHQHDGSMESMAAIMAEARPGIVYHLASLFLAQHRPEDIGPLVTSNILFPTQLADAMASHGVRHLVNAGTSWQHYQSTDYRPVCLYAATKTAYESILQYYCDASGLNVVTLKLFDTYGSGDPRPKLFRMLRDAARSRTPLSMSPGEQLIDLVHVDDVVEAFYVAAGRLLAGKETGHTRYAVSSGAPRKLKDIVELYARVTGIALDVTWGGREYRPREVMVPWTAGKSLPGWHPRVRLEEGIRDLERPDV